MELVNKKIFDIDFSNKNIAIIGKPTSGKTYLAGKLAELYPEHKLIHTDDYINHDREDLITYYLIRDIVNASNFSNLGNYIIEGVYIYNILNHPHFKPDLFIDVHISEKQMRANYVFDRNIVPNRKNAGFVRKHKALFDEFLFLNPHVHVLKINNNKKIL